MTTIREQHSFTSYEISQGYKRSCFKQFSMQANFRGIFWGGVLRDVFLSCECSCQLCSRTVFANSFLLKSIKGTTSKTTLTPFDIAQERVCYVIEFQVLFNFANIGKGNQPLVQDSRNAHCLAKKATNMAHILVCC